MNCLVTGGAGFIGSHLVDRLIKSNSKVVVIDNLSSGRLENLNQSADFQNLDLTDNSPDNMQRLRVILDKFKPRYVFHVASLINVRDSFLEPIELARANFEMVRSVLNATSSLTPKPKFIFSSSGGAIYDPQAEMPFREDSRIAPVSPYGQSKAFIEGILDNHSRSSGGRVVSLRYSNVYGPRQERQASPGVVANFIRRALNEENIILFGDGEQTRDFVYVSDVVSANILAMQEEVHGAFNVSSSRETSLNDLITAIERVTLKKIGVSREKPAPGDVRRSVLSNGKLERLGWSPEYSLERGITETVQWISQAYRS